MAADPGAPRTALVAFLQSTGCFGLRHSGRTLGDHLVKTHDLVKRLGGSDSAALAGGLHSIYGTNVFGTATLAYSARAELAATFGARAEYLAYLFSRMNRPRGLETGRPQDRETKARIELSPDDLSDLRLIEAANLLEQGSTLAGFPTLAAIAALVPA